jgi:hypothetical protein
MAKQQFKRWQVLLGVIGFLALMSFAGGEDYKAAKGVREAPPLFYVAEVGK